MLKLLISFCTNKVFNTWWYLKRFYTRGRVIIQIIKVPTLPILSIFSCIFHIKWFQSLRLFLCSKTDKRRPCWCSKLILRELKSFLLCWPREWKRSNTHVVAEFRVLWLVQALLISPNNHQASEVIVAISDEWLCDRAPNTMNLKGY